MFSATSHPAFVGAPLELIGAPWGGLVSHKSPGSRGSPSVAPVLAQNSLERILLDWLHLLPSLEHGAEQPQLQLGPSGKHIPAPSGAQTCSISLFLYKMCIVWKCFFFLLHSGLLSLPRALRSPQTLLLSLLSIPNSLNSRQSLK